MFACIYVKALERGEVLNEFVRFEIIKKPRLTKLIASGRPFNEIHKRALKACLYVLKKPYDHFNCNYYCYSLCRTLFKISQIVAAALSPLPLYDTLTLCSYYLLWKCAKRIFQIEINRI